jgi:hypothetical protein
MRDLVTVSIFTAYPEMQQVGEPFETSSATYETQPAGWGRGSVGLRPDGYNGVYPSLPHPVEAPENAHVEFRLGGSVVYEGVITRVSPNRTGFECEGYGLWAPRWATVDVGGAERVTSGVIVREAIRAVPWLRMGEVIDPGIKHAWDEVQYQKAGAVIEQMANEGDGTTPWMLRVYEGRLASFTPKAPSGTPDITLSYDPEMMQVGWEYERIDAVRILYRDRTGVERIWPEGGLYLTRAGIVSGDDYLRKETLTGSASTDGAIATAMTYLAQHSTVGLSGAVTFTDWQHLDRRYGDTFELLGYGSGIVESTRVDLFQGVTQMTLGEPSRMSGPGFLNALAETVAAMRTKVDVITKARAV